jgi:hypothetical protein
MKHLFPTVIAIGVLSALCAPGNVVAQCSSAPPPPRGEGPPPPPPPPPRFAPSDVVNPNPASPSTPSSPSSPSTPSGPSTPRGGPGGPITPSPAARAPGGPSTPRGTPIEFVRSERSKDLLAIQWDYPVPADDVQAMGFKQALAAVRGDDLRPLIVVRECYRCEDSDFVLLNRTLDNEKTLLLTRWFHCVKLTDHVRHEAHPFHGLFGGDDPPHMFLCDWTGESVFAFDGNQRQSELWKAMFKILDQEYRHDAKVAVKNLSSLLEDYDRLDSAERNALEQHDQALEKYGPGSPRYESAADKLAKVREDIEHAKAKERMISDLGLKRPKAAGSGD